MEITSNPYLFLKEVDQTRLRGLAVPYVDSRAIQHRLDDAVGCFGWRNEFRQWHENSQFCSISILHTGESGNHEWVGKCDGAENSAIAAVKGGLSDSFKRAAVLWGIGRYLYDFGAKWVDVENKICLSTSCLSVFPAILNGNYNRTPYFKLTVELTMPATSTASLIFLPKAMYTARVPINKSSVALTF